MAAWTSCGVTEDNAKTLHMTLMLTLEASGVDAARQVLDTLAREASSDPSARQAVKEAYLPLLQHAVQPGQARPPCAAPPSAARSAPA